MSLSYQNYRPCTDASILHEFLLDDVFSLEDDDHGETDLVHTEIDTGDARPKKQAPRWMPFTVRQEVAKQLKSMQRNKVIQASRSPWSSPVGKKMVPIAFALIRGASMLSLRRIRFRYHELMTCWINLSKQVFFYFRSGIQVLADTDGG